MTDYAFFQTQRHDRGAPQPHYPVVNSYLSAFLEHMRCIDTIYSYRSATMGSIFVARRAGSQHASRMTSTMRQGTIDITMGSLALSPNRKLAMIFRKKNAQTRPRIAPAIASRAPWRRTRHHVSGICAEGHANAD